MDVTKALNRVKEAINHEELEAKTRNMLTPLKLLNELEEHKIRGNEAFKANDYEKAAEHFTKGIDLYRGNQEVVKLEQSNDLKQVAISLFTNRALVYSKKKLDANVIADTTYVIENLSKGNIKELKANSIVFEDDSEEYVDEIICCTGFQNSFPYTE